MLLVLRLLNGPPPGQVRTQGSPAKKGLIRHLSMS